MKFTASKKYNRSGCCCCDADWCRSLREFLEFEFFGGDRGW